MFRKNRQGNIEHVEFGELRATIDPRNFADYCDALGIAVPDVE